MHHKQVTIAFIIAVGEAKIERFDPTPGFNRIVKYNGWVYFVGHCANGKDVQTQTQALCKRYEELFDLFHLKKENLVAMYAYVTTREEIAPFIQAYEAWVGNDNPTAGIAVCAAPNRMDNSRFRVELTFVMADF